MKTSLRLICLMLGVVGIGALPCGTTTANSRSGSAYVVTDDGARIHYIARGDASERPTVLFIPGWTWTADVWMEQMDRLDGRKTVAMDPRSQGDSSKTYQRNSPEGRAGDIETLLKALGNRPVVVVAWSQGVQDLAAYVERFGTDRLAGLVMVDSAVSTGSDWILQDPTGAKRLMDRIAILARYPKEYIGGMYDASRVRPGSDAEKARYVGLSQKTPSDIALGMLVTDLLTKNRTGALAKMDKPTLVIASAMSEELDDQRRIAERIPDARIIVVKDAGHAVFLDQPDAFADALEQFLNEIEHD